MTAYQGIKSVEYTVFDGKGKLYQDRLLSLRTQAGRKDNHSATEQFNGIDLMLSVKGN